jgi:hypothetical protein
VLERCTRSTANTPISVTISMVELSHNGPFHDGVDAALFCELPATTTKVIVQVWAPGRLNSALLIREFANDYTFAMP